jgi:hypothetical protein
MSTNKTSNWRESNKIVVEQNASGTGALSLTVSSGTEFVDNDDGSIYICLAAVHNINTNSWIVINGTNSYDGMHKITDTTNSGIYFKSTYVEETLSSNASVQIGIKPDCHFELLEINLHLSTSSGTAENMTIDLDAEAGSAFDHSVDTQAMAEIQDYNYTPTRGKYFFDGDAIIASWDNTDGRTYGFSFKYSRIR